MKPIAYLAASILTLACSATAAHASAWPQPAGQGQVAVTAIYSHSDDGFDSRGDSIDIDDYTKAEVYALIEYGVTDDLTLMATPSFSHVEIDGRGDSTGAGYTEVGARYRITGDRTPFSLQGTVRIPGKKRSDNQAQVGATDAEFDLRGLVGSSFKLGSTEGFVDFQAGYRFRNGGPPNEFRLDATVGVRPAEKLLLMAQSFNVISDGRGTGVFGKHAYSNIYVSAAYDITPRLALQIGGIATVAGRNALKERGFLAGTWLRF